MRKIILALASALALGAATITTVAVAAPHGAGAAHFAGGARVGGGGNWGGGWRGRAWGPAVGLGLGLGGLYAYGGYPYYGYANCADPYYSGSIYCGPDSYFAPGW